MPLIRRELGGGSPPSSPGLRAIPEPSAHVFETLRQWLRQVKSYIYLSKIVNKVNIPFPSNSRSLSAWLTQTPTPK